MTNRRLESHIVCIPEKSQFLIQNIFTLRSAAKKSSGRMFLSVDLLLKDLNSERERKHALST